MNITLISLAGFAGWTLLLTFAVVSIRMYHSFSGAKIPLNKFSPTGNDMPGLGLRITRAHLNCLESLPIFAAVVIAAGFSDQFAIMESTVMYVLYTRIGQSIVHIISTSIPMVLIRATLFTVQAVLLLYYTYQLLF